MNEMPTFRIELDGVRQSVLHAFMDAQDEIKEYTKQCIEQTMNPMLADRLEAEIARITQSALENSIKKVVEEAVRAEIDDYFNTGSGREAIINAIRKGVPLGGG